jgi:hypothetical protein
LFSPATCLCFEIEEIKHKSKWMRKSVPSRIRLYFISLPLWVGHFSLSKKIRSHA